MIRLKDWHFDTLRDKATPEEAARQLRVLSTELIKALAGGTEFSRAKEWFLKHVRLDEQMTSCDGTTTVSVEEFLEEVDRVSSEDLPQYQSQEYFETPAHSTSSGPGYANIRYKQAPDNYSLRLNTFCSKMHANIRKALI